MIRFAASFKTAQLKQLIIILSFLLISLNILAQHPKEVQTQNHFWWSLNTSAKMSEHWNLITDLHIRRTNFLKNNSFYFLRVGVGYTVNDQLSLATGAGHMWLANKTSTSELFTNENRIYQQAVLNNPLGKLSLSNRLRIEERWQQKIVSGALTNDYRYTTRFRYQLALNIPLSKNKKVPSIALADELLMQLGKDIVYNHFDQNRLFAGIKQQLSPSLSFDFGYMLVYQQKLSGYQYVKANTLRWYFYWKPDLRKKQKPQTTAFQIPEEVD